MFAYVALFGRYDEYPLPKLQNQFSNSQPLILVVAQLSKANISLVWFVGAIFK